MTSTVAVVGVSRLRTRAAVRERMHLPPEGAAALSRALADGAHEALVLTTCNRTEIYVTAPDREDAHLRARRALAAVGAGTAVARDLYIHDDEAAARHLFRVSGGLDAMVVGDTHVAAQVRHAHQCARGVGATGPLLDRLFETAAAVSKRVRTETSLSSGHTSVPAAAVAAANRLAGPLSERRLLVIGAGAMAQLCAQNAAWRGCRDIVVANRDIVRAQGLAERVSGRATSLDSLGTEVAGADVIITATAAPGFVVTSQHCLGASASRRKRPVVIFDIALPRDVDPALRDPPRVQLVDLDDLAGVVAASELSRRSGLEHAEAIAREEATRYESWRRSRAAVPAIVTLRINGEHARRAVLARHRGALARLAPAEQRLVETITSELAAKLLHTPTVELRRLTSKPGT